MSENNKNTTSQQEGFHRLISLIIDQMKAGYKKDEIINKLIEIGIERGEAETLVDTVVEEILNPPKK